MFARKVTISGVVRPVDTLSSAVVTPSVPIEAARWPAMRQIWRVISATEVLPLVPVTATIVSGTGVKNPSYYELFGFSDGRYIGNPNLKPEQSKPYELQWRSQLGSDSQLEASLYRTELSDAIIFGQDSIPRNVASARINGLELSLDQQWGAWRSQLGLALIDPRDRDSGHTLARRARRHHARERR